jgi:hypothetical protein
MPATLPVMTLVLTMAAALCHGTAMASVTSTFELAATPEDRAGAAIEPVEGGFIAARAWRVEFGAPLGVGDHARVRPGLAAWSLQDSPAAQPAARPVAFEYSDGYEKRRKIHYYASFAAIPLFATQYVLGDKLYEGTASPGQRTAHKVVAGSIAGLFGINTVTGVWNLVEARKNPAGRGRRLAHGLMMLGADAGFVATGFLAPGEDGSGDRSLHRKVAITSMAVATASYLMMLFWR